MYEITLQANRTAASNSFIVIAVGYFYNVQMLQHAYVFYMQNIKLHFQKIFDSNIFCKEKAYLIV